VTAGPRAWLSLTAVVGRLADFNGGHVRERLGFRVGAVVLVDRDGHAEILDGQAGGVEDCYVVLALAALGFARQKLD
jgi:hypothetical protein